MCGICAFICQHADDTYDLERKLLSNTSTLNRRGPDTHSYRLHNFGRDSEALFYGTVLHFRGTLTSQPLQGIENGNVLLWNGEIFGGIEVNAEENDGRVLLDQLSACRSENEILSTFSQIQGPWAAIFWQSSSNKLWFGRDVFGRRSLLVHVSSDGEIFGLSSVQLKQFESWQEVPASGLYCLKLNETDDTRNLRFSELTLYPWVHSEPNRTTRVVSLSEAKLFNESPTFDVFNALKEVKMTVDYFGLECHVPILNSALPDVAEMQDKRETSDFKDELMRWASAEQLRLAEELVKVLGEAVRVRVECQSHYCSRCITTFLDCTSDCALGTKQGSALLRQNCADDRGMGQRDENMFLRSKETSEQANDCVSQMAFEGRVDSLQDHVSSASVNGEMKVDGSISCDICRRYNFCRNKCTIDLDRNSQHYTDCHSRHDWKNPYNNECSKHCHSTEYCTSALSETIGSVTTGSVMSLDVCGVDRSSVCPHAKVAVLFSGGVDSLVIAALADKFVPHNEPIDLLNVAFEQQRNRSKTSSVDLFDVPDRVTGKQGLNELQTINPHRKWNFVEINVSLEELQVARTNHIRDLVYPLNTVLDDSIGCAVWFAARGKGVVRDDAGVETPYTSSARVCLVGMGADEQLAGYTRHRVRFNEGGWNGLNEEIQMEVKRISSRNLGRDDRVISDHSREARIPFLDENVVRFLSSLPIHVKTDLSLPRGVGEKFLLRLAALQLGLKKGALLQKRAIQFGSRIAKAENNREKASAVCDRLLSTAATGACP